MSVPCSFFTLNVVPHPHTGVARPIGIVLQSRPAEFLGMRVVTNAERLREVAPEADIEMLSRYLESCLAIVQGDEAAGEIALLSPPERFHWLAAPRSDVIQPSRVEYESAGDPGALLAKLYEERIESS
jgi:hypothetical protein